MNYEPPAGAAPRHEKFKGLAWSGLILGIVGIVGSIVPILNNLTALAALVGLILAVIAIFGTKRVLATIGGALCIVAIVVTVAMQDQFVKELDKQFESVTNGSSPGATSEGQGSAEADVILNGCSASTEYGMTNVAADVDITNSTDSPASYWVTIGVDDQEGNRLSEIHAVANDLRAGQTSKQSGQMAMTMIPEGNSDVNCSVVSVDRMSL